MRTLICLSAFASLMATTSCENPPPTATVPAPKSLVGEWVQLNPRAGVAEQVKIWTEGGIFMWTAKTETGATLTGGWGRYAYEREKGEYSETPSAMPHGVEVLVGERIRFELDWRQDGTLNLKGVLPGGIEVNEDYRRLGLIPATP